MVSGEWRWGRLTCLLHSRGPDDDDDDITVVVTVFAVADSRGARGWRVGVLGVSGDGGVGDLLGYTLLSFPSSPHSRSSSSPSSSSLITLAGGRDSAQVWAPHMGWQWGGRGQSRYRGGGGMPWWCRWAGWCGHDGTTATLSSPLSSLLSPLLEFAIGGGRDWAAPEVQVRMGGGAHLLVTGAGTGGGGPTRRGVVRGGGLGRSNPGWGLGVGWAGRVMG